MKHSFMIKLLFSLLLTIGGYNLSMAQDQKVFDVVEVMPQFHGGQAALISWLSDNIKYPKEAEKKRVQGRVLCTFVIEKDGSVSNIEVVKGVDPLLNEEAVRVLNSMPKWNPGKQNGKPVRVKYTIPISFKIPTTATKTTKNTVESPKEVEAKVFDVVEQMPAFGDYTFNQVVNAQTGETKKVTLSGQSALMRWLGDNIKYPAIAEENGIQGVVICNFIVEEDGSISDVKVLRSIDPSLDKEAVRVLSSMPKWKPGKQKGEPVRVKYTVPLTFRLQ